MGEHWAERELRAKESHFAHWSSFGYIPGLVSLDGLFFSCSQDDSKATAFIIKYSIFYFEQRFAWIFNPQILWVLFFTSKILSKFWGCESANTRLANWLANCPPSCFGSFLGLFGLLHQETKKKKIITKWEPFWVSVPKITIMTRITEPFRRSKKKNPWKNTEYS